MSKTKHTFLDDFIYEDQAKELTVIYPYIGSNYQKWEIEALKEVAERNMKMSERYIEYLDKFIKNFKTS